MNKIKEDLIDLYADQYNNGIEINNLSETERHEFFTILKEELRKK